MPQYKVIVDKDAKPITINMLCKCIIGMSLEDLAQEISINKDGKYDSLYEKS